MDAVLSLVDRGCLAIIYALLRLAVAIDDLRRSLPRRVRRWRGSLHRLLRRWRERWRPVPGRPRFHRRHAWNRTPEHVEDDIVRLHVEQPLLGAGQLRLLVQRLLAIQIGRETIRQILVRRRADVVALDQERRKRRRHIRVHRSLELWGMDLTVVWLLGFFPVWLLGIVDYHGSRLVAFERLPWPSARAVAAAVENAVLRHGAPAKLLTDRAPLFMATAVQDLLAIHSVRHQRTRPAHPWTNGRIERVFRTFKETVRGLIWLFSSLRQIDEFAADFMLWHNRDRPHSAWAGRTPDEVHSGRAIQPRPLGRVTYFGGRLSWYRFG